MQFAHPLVTEPVKAEGTYIVRDVIIGEYVYFSEYLCWNGEDEDRVIHDHRDIANALSSYGISAEDLTFTPIDERYAWTFLEA